MSFVTPVDGQTAIAEHIAQITETLSGVRAEAIALTSTLTVGGSPVLTQTTADALFLTPAEGNAAYATPASVTSAITTHEGLANPHAVYALDTDLAGYSLTSHNHSTLYEPLDSAYTKAEADARYEPIDTMYTKSESDAKYALATALTSLTTRVTTLEGQVATLITQMAGHWHDAGDWDALGGTTFHPPASPP